MIRTLTLNPAVDRAFSVKRLSPDAVMRASDVRDTAGGKGINVLRTVHALGGGAEGIVLLGGALGAYFRELCDPEWEIAIVPILEQTRLNIAIVADDPRTSLKVNERGPRVTAAELQSVLDLLDRRLAGGWLAICGAMPPGVDERVLTAIADTARAHGTRVAVDLPEVSAHTLLEMAPDVVKVNRLELDQLLTRSRTGDGDAASRAHELRTLARAETVIVGLGGEGAVLVTAAETLRLAVPAPLPGKPVGAGDALLAGFLLGQQRDWPLDRCFLYGMCAAITSAHQDRLTERVAVEAMMTSLALQWHTKGAVCR